MVPECECKTNKFKKGDVFYFQLHPQGLCCVKEGDIVFSGQLMYYCPFCGEELPDDLEV